MNVLFFLNQASLSQASLKSFSQRLSSAVLTAALAAPLLLAMPFGKAAAQSSVSNVGSQRRQGAEGNAQAELFYQLQQLQQEVMQLRGLVEEQSHQLKKLNKQRLDDYISLDKRISDISGGGGGSFGAAAGIPSSRASNVGSSVGGSTSAPAPVRNEGNAADEEGIYQAAYELVKQERYDDALGAFDDFLLLYPSGKYAPNAHYWAGELHLFKTDLTRAIKSFQTVVEQYPRHRKAPDAMFKLAKAYHVKGDTGTARSLLKRVITDYKSTGSTAPKLAKDYLDNVVGR